MKKTTGCPKSGIKIHKSDNDPIVNNEISYSSQQEFYDKIKSQNKFTGVRIEPSKNEYNIDPFDGINPFSNPDGEKEVQTNYNKSSYDSMDLNIDNYSINDIYKLFGINSQILSEDIMKISKKTVLKTHPDKSGLDSKYFIFFSKAYKRLYGIYEFQNKNTTQKKEDNNEYTAKTKGIILEKMFEKDKKLKEPENFNKWFNEQFDKHKIGDETLENGYGDWLKSDEDLVDTGNVSQANIGIEIEKRKKQIQTMSKYRGVDDQYASAFGGSTLMEYNNNFTSGSLFSNDGMGYTDLKQAYVESVIPVTEEDYKKMEKFNNVEEYKRYRNSMETKPLEKEESLKQLYNNNKQQEDESVALAYYYAKQTEKAQKSQETFWSGLKQLTNW